jgi:serine/threonine protein kinase
MTDSVVRKLSLPFQALRTVYEGGSEVRLYRNEVTGLLHVGKRVHAFGLEGAMVVEEATRLSRIRHDHIVPVHSVAEVAGYDPTLRPIEMVMPYYEMGSITDALARGERFTPVQARDLTAAALLGLSELHDSEQLIHRDFKSANVFLTGDSCLVRVGDLGVASAMDANGTVEPHASAQLFSAPEAFVQERIDRRADLYSAGLMLHELASGPLPWAEYDDRLSMATRLGRGLPAVLPRHLRSAPWVPQGMRAVIRKAVRPSPSTRYPTAGAMAAALARVPIVDWQTVDRAEDGTGQWQGAPAGRPPRQYRVTISRGRKSGWLAVGEQRVTAWRRVTPTVILDGPAGPQAADFFDQMVAIAFNR